MRVSHTGRIFAVVALVLLAGCEGGSRGGPVSSRPAAGTPAPDGGISCEHTCNASYDTCMDRFAGVGGSSVGGHSDAASAALGPNDVCPDQLKSCLRRCLN